jgi:hypothetical protein
MQPFVVNPYNEKIAGGGRSGQAYIVEDRVCPGANSMVSSTRCRPLLAEGYSHVSNLAMA